MEGCFQGSLSCAALVSAKQPSPTRGTGSLNNSLLLISNGDQLACWTVTRTLARRSPLGWKTPHCEVHQASLSGLKFVCRELSVTTCGLEFNFLMLSEHDYFFLSRGINKHTKYYELGAETDIDVGGEKKILEILHQE